MIKLTEILQGLNEQGVAYGDSIPTYLLDSLKSTVEYLSGKNKVLLLTTSNRGEYVENDKGDFPKSFVLATIIQQALGDKAVLFDVSKMKIAVCEGNVSIATGNNCGVLKSRLLDSEKNPTGHHRCWASINTKDDELWKISKELFSSDVVIFFGSNRWGQTNSIYQKLIERLNWLENRHTTLGEENIIANIESGMIWLGHNWNLQASIELQKQVHSLYGFNVNQSLYWGWQYTSDSNDESQEGYKNDFVQFKAQLGQ